MEKLATILVIDDDSAVRGWISAVLSKAGYTVLSGEDGSDAAPQMRFHPVELLITDIVMPGQEGIETIRAIRREFPDVKILAMSGANSTYLQLASYLGADASLLKPFSGAELLTTVRRLVG